MFNVILFYFGLVSIFLLYSCSAREGCTDKLASNFDINAQKSNGTCKYILLQNTLDTTDNVIKIGSSIKLTGGAHGDTSSIRDIFTSIGIDSVYRGQVFSLRIYPKNAQGERDSQNVNTLIMVKREYAYSYYYEGDFEYIIMPFDTADDRQAHPNGQLKASLQRGDLEGCAGCHKNAPGNDYIFSR